MPIRIDHWPSKSFKVNLKTELEVSDECCDSGVIFRDSFIYPDNPSFSFVCLWTIRIQNDLVVGNFVKFRPSPRALGSLIFLLASAAVLLLGTLSIPTHGVGDRE